MPDTERTRELTEQVQRLLMLCHFAQAMALLSSLDDYIADVSLVFDGGVPQRASVHLTPKT